MMAGTTPATGRESGFTLIELLAVIAIGPLLVGVIVSALVFGYRATDSTTTRLAESHDTQLVANWFPNDVASAAPGGITTSPSAPTGCAGSSAGTNVIVLPYAFGPGDDLPVSSYRLDTANKRLIRYHCLTAGVAQSNVVAGNVSDADVVVTTRASGQSTVTLTITAWGSGREFTVTGHGRTPTAPLASPTPSPPPVAPPLPCNVDSASAAPNPVALASGTTLSADVTVTVALSGGCLTPLSISFVAGPSGPAVDVPLTPSGSTYTAVLAKAAYPWTAGTKTVTVNHSGPVPVTNRTFTLTVAAACRVETFSATPNPVALGSGTTLAADVNVSLTISGLCSTPLNLSFTPGSSGSPVTVPMALAGNTYIASLSRSAYAWTAGTKTITVQQASAVAVQNPSFTLTVNPAPPCAITAGTADPNPADRKSGKLKKSVDISITTTGVCSGLQLAYSPTAGTNLVLNLAQAGSTWIGTLPANNQAWSAGPHALTVVAPSFSFTLTVNP